MFIYMIYLRCSRRPSDVGSTVTNCSKSCTLLIGHTEPKSVYSINSLHAGVFADNINFASGLFPDLPDIMWDYLDIMMVFSKQSFKKLFLKKKSGQQNTRKTIML